ncbi:MAG: multicopper oxidase family protein [Anaerolineae bacterium]
MVTRRRLLKSALAGGVFLLPPLGRVAPAAAAATVVDTKRPVAGPAPSAQIPQVPLDGASIPKFVEALPTFVGNRVDGTKPLTITVSEIQQKVLPESMYVGLDAPYDAGTYVWAYGISDGTSVYPPHYPGFTIEARRLVPTRVHYVNQLEQPDGSPPVLQQYITIDQTLHWANPLGLDHMDPAAMEPYSGPVPVSPHLHGGEVASIHDGGPDSWFTPGLGIVGPAWNQGVSDNYYYHNAQEAATIWIHDHALGATRTNVYCGLALFYFLRDLKDTGKPNNPLKLPAGNQEVEFAIQDRFFDTNGQLLFPDGSDPELEEPPNPETHPFWIPEFFGNTIVVNGKTWPYMEVEPRRYRLHMLVGSSSRFYTLRVFPYDPQTQEYAGEPLGPLVPFWQIGTDGGMLDRPVRMDELTLAPGERADVIVDFGGMAGQTLLMSNTANGPFPDGDATDPNTAGQIVQFRVGTTITGGSDTTYNPATGKALRLIPIVRLAQNGALARGVRPAVTRQLTLNEVIGPGGPLEVLVNNTKWEGTLSPNAGGITELPQVGATEVWEIINMTMDTHPIHVHLVQFQLLNRQGFDHDEYMMLYDSLFPGGQYLPAYGPPQPYGSTPFPGGNPDVTPFLREGIILPDANEVGWKDTVKMHPRQVTRIVVRFAPQGIPVAFAQPGWNLYPFDATTGPGYVWHCHIIDHEDNEMMRPYKLVKLPQFQTLGVDEGDSYLAAPQVYVPKVVQGSQ